MASTSTTIPPKSAEGQNFPDPWDPLNQVAAIAGIDSATDLDSPGNYFVVCDCDGVLTDGSYIYDKNGKIAKRYSVYDHDGYNIIRSVFPIYFITSDRGEGLEIHRKRLSEFGQATLIGSPHGHRENFIISEFGPLSHCIFIGDSWEDGKIIAKVAFGFAPACSMAAEFLYHRGIMSKWDISDQKISLFHPMVLERTGGDGVLFEVALKLASYPFFMEKFYQHPLLKS